MVNKNNVYKLSREELKHKSACDFEHGDTVICGKYYIHISYFKSGYDGRMPVSFFTTVNTEENLCDLPIKKHPQYIRNFIECYEMVRNM